MGRHSSLLTESFCDYFSVRLALTEEQKSDAYGIRYRVYCEEFEYEPADNFPDELECDEFDAQAMHCVITHKSSGMPAGCVRIVPALEKTGASGLPLEKYCAASLDMVFINGLQIARSSMCEISRLAVDGAFRRRAGETVTRFGEIDALDCSHQERRTFSLISVAAFLAATAVCDLSGRHNAFAMMEPFLPRLLKKSGIEFRRVGDDIDYHGIRAPYFSTVESAMKTMAPDLKALYEVIHQSISDDWPLSPLEELRAD